MWKTATQPEGVDRFKQQELSRGCRRTSKRGRKAEKAFWEGPATPRLTDLQKGARGEGGKRSSGSWSEFHANSVIEKEKRG